MIPENSMSDPEKLQQLVDGELSESELRRCLSGLDDTAAQWRLIACSFVEDQLFRKQFGDEIASGERSLAKRLPVNGASQRENRSWLSSMVLAASLLLVALLGYLAGSNEVPGVPAVPLSGSNQIARQETPANQQPRKIALDPADLRPEYRMELLTPDGESLGSEVYLYEYGDLNRLVGHDISQPLTVEKMLPPSGLSPDLRRQLSRSGYEVQESTHFMSGRLDDGRAFVVPVRSICFDRGH